MVNILRHDRDEVGDFQRRVLMHIPIGLLMGIPFLGSPLHKLFIKYEENEDKWVKDQAWKDYFGAMIGVSITTILIILLLVYITVCILLPSFQKLFYFTFITLLIVLHPQCNIAWVSR